MATITLHTFEHCKSWPSYHAAYLAWMQKHDHPDLRKSNWNAQTLQYELSNPPIPVLEVPEIYDHKGP